MWCIRTVECYAATERNEVPPRPTIWMKLEDTMLSETNQSEKTTSYVIAHVGNSDQANL